MSGNVMSIGDFLQHSTRSDKRAYLTKWRQEAPYSTIVWLHCLAQIVAVWRHNFPNVVARENKQTRVATKEVWSANFNCLEVEAVLKRQSYRNKEVGGRDTPPEKCPMCFMIEHVRDLVEAGQLDWRTPIFRFEGSDPSKTQVLHAGGIYNGFGDKTLTVEDKKQLYEAGIYMKTAFKENLMAKMNYIFSVVEHAHPEKGIQVAIEASLLGDKVKSVIAHMMKSKGTERGNPTLHPYAIEWSYNPADGIEFNKKYDACPMESVPLTPQIDKLIRQTDAPDLSSLLNPPNFKSMLAKMQQHALIDLPFESFFRNVDMNQTEPEKPVNGAGQHPGTRVPGAQGRPPVVGQGFTRPGLPAAPAPLPRAPAQEEMVGCDVCNTAIPISAAVCPHCGTHFEMEGAPPAPPPARLPTRSEARAARAQQAAPMVPPPQQAHVPAEPSVDYSEDYVGEPDDEIPFISQRASRARHLRRRDLWMKW